MVDFGGWALPVQYSSILEEHKAVRERCGLFDVSHMGELFVRGENAFAYLQNHAHQRHHHHDARPLPIFHALL